MSAYLIVHATINDLEKFKEYGAGAGPSLQAHGAEMVARGLVSDVLTGSHDHKMTAIFKFPDAETARTWYASDSYQAMIPTREKAIDATFIVMEEAT